MKQETLSNLKGVSPGLTLSPTEQQRYIRYLICSVVDESLKNNNFSWYQPLEDYLRLSVPHLNQEESQNVYDFTFVQNQKKKAKALSAKIQEIILSEISEESISNSAIATIPSYLQHLNQIALLYQKGAPANILNTINDLTFIEGFISEYDDQETPGAKKLLYYRLVYYFYSLQAKVTRVNSFIQRVCGV